VVVIVVVVVVVVVVVEVVTPPISRCALSRKRLLTDQEGFHYQWRSHK